MEYDLDIFILVAVILVSVFAFFKEWLPLEVTALSATGILLLTNVITVEEMLSGFSNKAVIIIGAIFIISKSLVKTGFLEVIADKLYNKAGDNKWFIIFVFLVTTSIISGFINNTAAVAIFIPLAINLCQKFHISPTKVLLPLSYAAIFGGTLTLIGTSTNLLVNSILEETISPTGEYYQPFRMFEFTKLGLIFLGIGTIYNIIIAKWFIPSRAIVSSLTQKYHLGTYLTEFKVPEGSPLIGRTTEELDVEGNYNLQIYKIIRFENVFRFSLKKIVIKPGDIFVAQVSVANMVKFRDEMKVLLLTDVKMSEDELAGKNHVIVEGLIPIDSNLIGKTIMQFDFRERFTAFVLAIKRQQELLREKVAHIKLKFSDTLLVMVPRENLDSLRKLDDMIILEELDIHLRYERYWWVSILIIPTVMILASFNIVSITKGALLGAILLLALKSLSIDEAYNSINWSVIFLIAALIPLGTAIHKTGLDQVIGEGIIYSGDFIASYITVEHKIVYLSLLYFFTFTMSAFISNAAVAVLITPVAFIMANNLAIDPRPLLVAVCFGASASFMTPMGYQTNMMVYAPGKYRFKDFMYFGLPLTLIFWGVATYYIPRFWPF